MNMNCFCEPQNNVFLDKTVDGGFHSYNLPTDQDLRFQKAIFQSVDCFELSSPAVISNTPLCHYDWLYYQLITLSPFHLLKLSPINHYQSRKNQRNLKGDSYIQYCDFQDLEKCHIQNRFVQQFFIQRVSCFFTPCFFCFLCQTVFIFIFRLLFFLHETKARETIAR